MVVLTQESVAMGVVAHRGASLEAPENTLAAFQRAIDLEADMIELDLMLTKDGIPVAFHDATISRTCCPGRQEGIHDLSLQEVRRLDAGAWFDASFQGEKVPLLLEILCLRRGRTGLMLELKKGPYPAEELAAAVVEELDCDPEWNSDSLVIIGSQDPDLVEALIPIFPQERILGIVPSEEILAHYRKLGIRNLSLGQSLVTKERLKELTEAGCRVWVWTVDDPTIGQAFSLSGATGIITNDPRAMLGQEATAL